MESNDKGVGLRSVSHPNWEAVTRMEYFAHWLHKKRCALFGHGPIVSVIDGKPLRHLYDYCKHCGQTWFRSPVA